MSWPATFFVLALLFFVGFVTALLLGIAGYIWIAADLPDPAQLEARQSRFASSRVFDRHGNLLVELTDSSDPSAGRRVRVRLDQVSDWVKRATIATEDRNFYRYRVGFDPIALARAVWYALNEREFVSGGSTITQQVSRNLLLSAEERQSRSLMRKLREIVLANELARRYSRDQILEIYLNELYYANQAYGIEAAAQTYFGKPARDLTLAEASLLAGIPQSPALWDPVRNKQHALRRQRAVLDLMVEAGYITSQQADAAAAEMANREFRPPPANLSPIAPHFVNYVRQQLDAEFGPQGLFRDGLKVYATLDPGLQRIAENAVREQLARLRDRNVTNAAVVILQPQTGHILAMVGSADFFDERIDGQVNVALALRQPGSAVKPFTYLAAMERGWTPSTLIWDTPKEYVNAYGQVYRPRNYDGKFHGPVLLREALARSLNIPAVEALNFVTVPEFLKMAERVGLNFPPNPAYGLAIALGGAETRLLDLTAAYATLATGGVRRLPLAISRVERADGTLLRDYTQPPHQQVVLPEHAYLITHILSDNEARAKTFGRNSPLRLPFPAAAKTGTTDDFRDNLTVGYSAELVVGVWVGNSDNSPMRNVSGITGAAPIWNQIMLRAHEGRTPRNFPVPPGIVSMEICTWGGRVPSSSCPAQRRRMELFKADQLPLPPDEVVERAVAAGDPRLLDSPDAVASLPPQVPPQMPPMFISAPASGQAVMRGLISVRGTVNPSGFQSYWVEYGEGDNPAEWRWVSGPHLSAVVDGQLTVWDAALLPPGRYTLRVTAQADNGTAVAYSSFDLLDVQP
ncbi:MAG: transglycosylase domain-containing protein [Thermoflexales bacterium]